MKLNTLFGLILLLACFGSCSGGSSSDQPSVDQAQNTLDAAQTAEEDGDTGY